jgi:nucleoside-diphosphate-sugar epimerase
MKTHRIFVAGAGGAIGRRLVPQLIAAGHTVFGTTRSSERAALLQRLGALPILVDVYDRQRLIDAVREARPDTVMHQMTDLPQSLSDAGLPEQVLASNARVRTEGGRNLVDAALAAQAQAFIAQSLAWVYAAGPAGQGPHTEADPLDTSGSGTPKSTVQGVMALEQMTLESPPLRGVVLRYGMLYGPGTWNATASGAVPVHVDAAAHAALLALHPERRGIFNIAEERGLISAAKARRELGWQPEYRLADQPVR